MKNAITLMLLWGFINNIAICQNSTHRYRFVVNEPEPVLINGNSGYYYGKDREFVSKRIYFNGNTYIEGGLFSKDTSNLKNFIGFKFFDNKWFINQGKDWKYLIKKNKFKKVRVLLYNQRFQINWGDSLVIHETTLYSFTLKPIGFFASEQNTYFFSRHFGIVAIESSDGLMFIREDV